MGLADKTNAKTKNKSPVFDIENTPQVASKSQFKSQLLRYLRQIEKEKRPLIVTHAGKPVVKVTPYCNKEEIDATLNALKNSVVYYGRLRDPVENRSGKI
jgi:prevent-host-death family protein